MAETRTKGGRLLVEPSQPIPGRLRMALDTALLTNTDRVHDAIRAGGLEKLQGIGPTTARQILKLYTKARPGSNWGGPRDCGPDRKLFPHRIEAQVNPAQLATVDRLRAELAQPGKAPVSIAVVLRHLIDTTTNP